VRRVERVPKNVKDFYQQTAQKIFDVKNSIVDLIKDPFIIYIHSNENFLKEIEILLSQLNELKNSVKPLKDVDPQISSKFTPKMKKGYRAARRIARSQKIILEAIEKAKVDERTQEILEISKRQDIPERLKKYLVQSSILYFLGLYESSITMIGRATEFILKEFFKRNKIQFEDDMTLGELIGIYEKNFGRGKIQKHILEVNKIDRNISSHDDQRIITKKDADHMRTAIMVILNDLLNIDLNLKIED
jgi:hypothetical protein